MRWRAQFPPFRAYRPERQGVARESGDAGSGYNRAGVYILDDWR